PPCAHTSCAHRRSSLSTLPAPPRHDPAPLADTHPFDAESGRTWKGVAARACHRCPPPLTWCPLPAASVPLLASLACHKPGSRPRRGEAGGVVSVAQGSQQRNISPPSHVCNCGAVIRR